MNALYSLEDACDFGDFKFTFVKQGGLLVLKAFPCSPSGERGRCHEVTKGVGLIRQYLDKPAPDRYIIVYKLPSGGE